MIDFVVKGAIFDVDDTLLDNKPHLMGQGLHERSRLAAVHEIGKRLGIKGFIEYTDEQNFHAFRNASVHTIEGAVWTIMLEVGLVNTEAIDKNNPLLREIVARKDELHEQVLIDEGEEVPGAGAFIEGLAQRGLADKMAIASSGIKRDINIFLNKIDVKQYFPDERIISFEKIKHAKPDPEIFNLAFDSLGLRETDRKQTVAFEDDPRGITSAAAAGLYVCAITWRFPREELAALEVPPHLIADSFKEFAVEFGFKI